MKTLELATLLAQIDDSIVSSCICSGGVQDRKINPGILVLALRFGLIETDESERNMSTFPQIEHLLMSVGDLLRRPKLVGSRSLLGVCSRDFIQNLCHMARLAPALSDSLTFEQVVAGMEEYDGDMDDRQAAAVEARRLLFGLLADASFSPLLRNLAGKTSTSQNVEQTLVKGICLWLDNRGDLESHKVVIQVLKQTPSLVRPVLRIMPFPDSKMTFPFLARLNFVSRLRRYGPSVSECIVDSREPHADNLEESVIESLVPSRLKKQPLAKALLNPNPLLVCEVLKLTQFVLQGYEKFLDEWNWKEEDKIRFGHRMSSVFSQWLPDLQQVLSAVDRADPAASRANEVVFLHTVNTLRKFCSIWPKQLEEVRFEWSKILRNDFESFNAMVSLGQRSVLLVFDQVSSLQMVSCRNTCCLSRGL